jgi:hypothetical protein
MSHEEKFLKALAEIGTQLKNLGTGDAAITMEAMGTVKEGAEQIAEGLFAIATAINDLSADLALSADIVKGLEKE